MTNQQTLLIFGASARAAAHSAVRARMQPVCADVFADEDLHEVADVLPLENYPHDLPHVAKTASGGPWMYTGALENHPQIIAAISAERRLWGNGAEAVAKVRDPFEVYALLSKAKLPAAAVRSASDAPQPDGHWMLKPIRSAGGRGIHVWDKDAGTSKTLKEPHYFQQKLTGTPISALFLAARRQTWLIGVARQFVGDAGQGRGARAACDPPLTPSLEGGEAVVGGVLNVGAFLNAPPYAYCGSIGPIELGQTVGRQIRRAGEVLARHCQLRGLFGGDFLCDGQAARLTEINPRYTASVEVFEHAYDIALLDWHRRACESFENSARCERLVNWLQTATADIHHRGPRRMIGKAILYAPRDLIAPSLAAFINRGVPPALPGRVAGSMACLADRPAAGTQIKSGHPFCSILAAGDNVADCRRELATRVRELSVERIHRLRR